MMKKRIKRAGASVLVAALVFSAFVLPKSVAALDIDTDASCAMEINVGKNVGGNYTELSTVPVTIDLYRVASVDTTGDYIAGAGYETLDLNVDEETTADEWMQLAAAAKALVDAEGTALEPVRTVATANGSVTVTDLATGLYLIDAQQAQSDANVYDFTPYLISLPDNRYYDIGNDRWIYDLTGSNAIGLKPLKADRYGDLVIEKFLDTYNATNVGATFVFQVEGTKTDVDTGEVKVIYSDVVSMTFDGAGTDSITIEDIPAGSEVTVTEIYSGGCYELTSEGTVTATIIADGADVEPATVEFNNTYDDTHTGGSGLVNQFEYNSETGSWTHSTR